MKTAVIPALLGVLLLASPARAEPPVEVSHDKIDYFQDPLYEKINKDDEHPMDDMTKMAEDGEVRAQFIMGDLYSKGQGGLPKDLRKARYWFEQGARNKDSASFVRLAALEKRAGNAAGAYMWYTLGIDQASGDMRRYMIQAREDLVGSAKLTRQQTADARKAGDAWRRAPKEARNDKDAAAKPKTPDKTSTNKTGE